MASKQASTSHSLRAAKASRQYSAERSEEQNGVRLSQIPLSLPKDGLRQYLIASGGWTAGTCKSFLDEEAFHEWQRQQGGFHVLALVGAPGTGKTMMSAFLVHHLEREFRNAGNRLQFAFAYFFCSARDPRRSTALSVLRGLIYGLSTDSDGFLRSLRRSVKASRRSSREILRDFGALWQVFVDAILEQASTRFTFLIDALDECNAQERMLLLNHFRRLQTHPNVHELDIKLFVTCRRPGHYLPLDVPASRIAEMGTDRVTGDIKSFIADSVAELDRQKSYGTELVEKLEEALLERSKHNFLWASLAVKQLAQLDNEDALESVRESNPPGLYKFYDEILCRANPRHREIIRFLLHLKIIFDDNWTLTYFAIALRIAAACIDDPALLATDAPDPSADQVWATKRLIANACPDLVTIDRNTEQLRLFHPSVQDYLLERQEPLVKEWMGDRCNVLVAFFALVLPTLLGVAVACETALLFPLRAFVVAGAVAAMAMGVRWLWLHRYEDIQRTLERTATRWAHRLAFPRLIRGFYHVDIEVASFWAFQICFQSLGVFTEQDATVVEVLTELQDFAKRHIHMHVRKCPAIVAAKFPWKARFAPSKSAALHAWLVDDVSEKSTTFAQELIETGVDLEQETDRFPDSGCPSATPLAVAMGNEIGSAIDHLLAAGAVLRGSVLHWLLSRRMSIRDTVYERITVDNGAAFIGDYNFWRDEFLDCNDWSSDRSMLQFPEWSWMKDLRISTALARGVKDGDFQGEGGITALWWAARLHQWEVVHALLKQGADANIKDYNGMTPLLWALHSPRTRMLVGEMTVKNHSAVWIGRASFYHKPSGGGEVDPVDSNDSFLDRALDLLVTKTADLEATDFGGRTALSLAVENGYWPAVEKLLAGNAKVDSVDEQGITPLMWACQTPRFRQIAVNRLEVGDNSTVYLGPLYVTAPRHKRNVPTPKGAPSPRAQRHRLQIVEALCTRVADINAQDHAGAKAIDFATADFGPRNAVVNLLLRHGSALHDDPSQPRPQCAAHLFRPRPFGKRSANDSIDINSGCAVLSAETTLMNASVGSGSTLHVGDFFNPRAPGQVLRQWVSVEDNETHARLARLAHPLETPSLHLDHLRVTGDGARVVALAAAIEVLFDAGNTVLTLDGGRVSVGECEVGERAEARLQFEPEKGMGNFPEPLFVLLWFALADSAYYPNNRRGGDFGAPGGTSVEPPAAVTA